MTDYTLDQKISQILDAYQRNLAVATEAYRREVQSAVCDLTQDLEQRLKRSAAA